MTRRRTSAELEVEALAAIGEALLFAKRGDPAAVSGLMAEGMRFVSSNAVRKALSELCRNAGHDPNWRVSTEARLRMHGGQRALEIERELAKGNSE